MMTFVSKLLQTNGKGQLLKFMSSTSLTKVSQSNGVLRIALNNPDKRNALSLAMLKELQKNLRAANNNPAVRCIVLSGEGPAFSAGHDLKELTSQTGIEYHESVFSTCSEVMTAIRTHSVPVIAQVNGIAAAAGCQLASTCDIVIATEKSKFSTPGVNVGLFCSTPGVAVSRAVSRKISAYMLFTGLPISAQEASQYGLVSKVVSEEDLEEETLKIVSAIMNKSKSVISLGKQFYHSQLDKDIDAAYRQAEKVMVDNLRLSDTQKGLKAFFEKTKPNWDHTDKKIH